MKQLKSLLGKAVVAAVAIVSMAACSKPEKEVYLFTSHREPALDGLHLLYSYDGLHWDSLAGVWLKPEIGNQSLYVNIYTNEVDTPKYYKQCMMRDPSILQGPDGTFHYVWTTGWSGSKGFGYASSKDLIHWSEQREIPVMKDSLTNNVWAPELFYDDEKEQFLVIWSSAIPSRMFCRSSLSLTRLFRAAQRSPIPRAISIWFSIRTSNGLIISAIPCPWARFSFVQRK